MFIKQHMRKILTLAVLLVLGTSIASATTDRDVNGDGYPKSVRPGKDKPYEPWMPPTILEWLEQNQPTP